MSDRVSEQEPAEIQPAAGRRGADLEREAERAAHAVTAATPVGELGSAGPAAQRFPFDGLAELAAAGSALLGISRVIVDDATAAEPGQLQRTGFLARLDRTVRNSADPLLATVGRSTANCPFIARWLEHYADVDAARLERAARLYTLTTPSTADELLASLGERIERAVRVWIDSGQVTGIPRFGPGDLAADGDAAEVARAADGDGPSPRASPDALRSRLGPGRPLDAGPRGRMEQAFGTSFAGVRVHTDAAAGALARDLSAHAFTVGSDIAFAPGQLRPGTPRGDGMLAHELAHVIQQRGGSSAVTGDPEHAADTALEAAALREQDPAAAAPAVVPTGLAIHRCGDDPPDSPSVSHADLAAERAANADEVHRLTRELNAELAARDVTVGDASLSGVDLADRLDAHDLRVRQLRHSLEEHGVRLGDSPDPARDITTLVRADPAVDLTAYNARLDLSCGTSGLYGDAVAMRVRLDYVPPNTPIEVQWRYTTTSLHGAERLFRIWSPGTSFRNQFTDATLGPGFWEDPDVLRELAASHGEITVNAHVFLGGGPEIAAPSATATFREDLPSDPITLNVTGGAIPGSSSVQVVAAVGAELTFEPSWVPPPHRWVTHWYRTQLPGGTEEEVAVANVIPDTASIRLRFATAGTYAIVMRAYVNAGRSPWVVWSAAPPDVDLPPPAAIQVQVKTAEEFGTMVLDRLDSAPTPRPELASFITGLGDQEAEARRYAGRAGTSREVYEARADALWTTAHDIDRRVPGARTATAMPASDADMLPGAMYSAPVTGALVLPENQGAQPLNLYLTVRYADEGGTCSYRAVIIDGTSKDAWTFSGQGIDPESAARAAFADMESKNPYPVGGHVHYRFRRAGWSPIQGMFETTTVAKKAEEWIENILMVLGFVAAALLLMLPEATITKWLGVALLAASIGMSIRHIARNVELGIPLFDSRNVLEGVSILASVVGLGGTVMRTTALAGLRLGVGRPALFRWGNRLIITAAAMDVGTFVYTTNEALAQLQAALADPNLTDQQRLQTLLRLSMQMALSGVMLFTSNRELFTNFRGTDYFGSRLPTDLDAAHVTLDAGTRMDVLAELRRTGWSTEQLRTAGAAVLYSRFVASAQMRGEVDVRRIAQAAEGITDPALREQLLTDPRVWRALHNEDYNPATLVAAWRDYNRRRSPSAALRSASFGEYLGRRGFDTELGGVSRALPDVFPNWATMTVPQQQRAVLARAEPALAAALAPGGTGLPTAVKTAINAALDGNLIGGASTYDGARGNIMSHLNELLGRTIANPTELASVLRLVGSSGNIGSIGEHYAQHHLTSPTHRGTDLVHAQFTPAEIPGLTVNPFLPDRVVVAAARTVDIKTGYARTQIDLAQARNYEAMRAASHADPALATRVGGPMGDHVWLFQPGGDAPASVVARREHTRLGREGLLDHAQVMYLGDDGVIYAVRGGGQPDLALGSNIHAALGLP